MSGGAPNGVEVVGALGGSGTPAGIGVGGKFGGVNGAGVGSGAGLGVGGKASFGVF